VKKHGMIHTREYRIWAAMVGRCHSPSNPAFPDYGGRGVVVCDEWRQSFLVFREDMGECPAGLTIDRKDNDGGYSKGNCRWATKKEQARNRRSSVLVTYQGVTQPLAAWEEQRGLPSWFIGQRLHKGWTIDDAFEVPAGGRRRTVIECSHPGPAKPYGKTPFGSQRLRCARCGATWTPKPANGWDSRRAKKVAV
jgi:hypothetical protein